MAECFVSEVNKNINSSSKQSSDVPSCQEVKTEEEKFISGSFISAMEPILLEDSQRSNVSTNLMNLMKVFEEQEIKPSKSDFLVGCVYIFMLECGFIPKEKANTYSDSEFSYRRIKELIPDFRWKKANENTYCLSFILEPYQLYVCEVLCIKTGDDLVINAIVRNIENAYSSIMLDILSFYTDGANQNANLKNIQNLRLMSTLFKEQIAFPIKHAILRIVEHRHPSLEDLPPEIILEILQYLPGMDIVRLTSTCKRFYIIRQEVRLWEHLLERDHNISMKGDNYIYLFKKYGSFRKSSSHHLDYVWTTRYNYRASDNVLH